MLKLSLKHNSGDFPIDISFETKPRSITSIFGRSGSGKTSIINMIAGLKKPDNGIIKVGDDTLLDTGNNIDLPPEKRGLGYVFQDGRLFPHMNVRKNLLYGFELTTNDTDITFDHVIDILKIASLLERKPTNLSGGEKQLVAIGRAILTQPRLLLMDEPLASIDTQLRGKILPFIEELRDKLGLTIIYVSHTIDEVIRLSDKMVLISNGTKKAEGNVEEVMGRLDLHPLTGRFDAGAVITTIVKNYDEKFDLTGLSFKGGTLNVTGAKLPIGETVRVHVRARDVSLSKNYPKETSVLNIFEGKIIEIGDQEEAQIDIKIDIGSTLIARITKKSFEELKLKKGSTIFTMLKAVAIDRRSSWN